MTARRTANDWIKALKLAAHPEGGWYRETYRSADLLPAAGLPPRFTGPRAASTAIYYLLEAGQFSALHRIRSDEVWHFYAGDAVELTGIDPSGTLLQWRLGAVEEGDSPQVVVPAGVWFGARCAAGGEYALCGCTVAPGFDFADFEMAERSALMAQCPEHRGTIESLTHA